MGLTATRTSPAFPGQEQRCLQQGCPKRRAGEPGHQHRLVMGPQKQPLGSAAPWRTSMELPVLVSAPSSSSSSATQAACGKETGPEHGEAVSAQPAQPHASQTCHRRSAQSPDAAGSCFPRPGAWQPFDGLTRSSKLSGEPGITRSPVQPAKTHHEPRPRCRDSGCVPVPDLGQVCTSGGLRIWGGTGTDGGVHAEV